MSHIVLVSGSREFPSSQLVKDRIRTALTPGDRLMHGCARGVDTWAEDVAHAIGATILRRPVDWDRYGKRAGMLRNEAMLNKARQAVRGNKSLYPLEVNLLTGPSLHVLMRCPR